MVSLSFSSFKLVLFIFLTIKVSIAHTDQAKLIFHEAENGFAMELAGSYQSVEKKVFDGVPTVAILKTNGRMGGRKMMTERRNMKKKVEDSKNSGASATHYKLRVMWSKMSTSHSVKANTGNFVALNADFHMKTSIVQPIHLVTCEKTYIIIIRCSVIMDAARGIHSIKLASTDQPDNSESFQKLESGKLLEDATEFLNMMNKDYSGGPGSGSKPRHKTPINNYQPFHGSNP